MINNVDVFQQQSTSYKLEKTSVSIDYRRKDPKGALAPRFLLECAIKLSMKPLTSATASIIFHRFYREVESANYDELVM